MLFDMVFIVGWVPLAFTARAGGRNVDGKDASRSADATKAHLVRAAERDCLYGGSPTTR